MSFLAENWHFGVLTDGEFSGDVHFSKSAILAGESGILIFSGFLLINGLSVKGKVV